jgi:hypothetical protein
MTLSSIHGVVLIHYRKKRVQTNRLERLSPVITHQPVALLLAVWLLLNTELKGEKQRRV